MGSIPTLVFAGGAIHDWQGCGAAILDALRADGGFDLTYITEDLDALVAPRLDPYELLVFYYTVGSLTDAQRDGLLGWLAGGKGFVGIHSAADSFRDCPEYRAMIGGHFVTHPHYRTYQVSVADAEHPVTAGLDEFFVTDEQYILDWDRRNHVLATALYRGEAMPVAWTKPWGRGRVYYLALGHNAESARAEIFATLLCRGARWAATPAEA